MVSIRWYLRPLKGQLGGAGIYIYMETIATSILGISDNKVGNHGGPSHTMGPESGPLRLEAHGT